MQQTRKHTTIRNPSDTSPRSLAALTRDRAFVVSSLLSKSGIAVIQGSPTLESSMRVVSSGGNVMSVMRFESGFSILYGWGGITIRDEETGAITDPSAF